MALYGTPLTLSLAAGADLTAHMYKAVRVSGANTVLPASLNSNHECIGILQNDPKSGQPARIAYAGESKAVAGGNITAGAAISHNSSGHVIAATSGLIVIGNALEAAAADQIIRVLIQRGALAKV